MSPSPSPNEKSVGLRLAEFIAERHERILSEWEDTVRRDQTVPTADQLTPGQLTDHIPKILAGLSQMLCDTFNQELLQDAAYDAAIHGHMRWEQRYDISQLLREISHLRATLIYHVTEFQEHTPDFRGTPGLLPMTALHSYFDRLMRISVEEFLASAERGRQSE